MPAEQKNNLQDILEEITTKHGLRYLERDLPRMLENFEKNLSLDNTKREHNKKYLENSIEIKGKKFLAIRNELEELKHKNPGIENSPEFDTFIAEMNKLEKQVKKLKENSESLVEKQEKYFRLLPRQLGDIKGNFLKTLINIRKYPSLKDDNSYVSRTEKYIKFHKEKLNRIKKELKDIKQENPGIEKSIDYQYLAQYCGECLNMYKKIENKLNINAISNSLSENLEVPSSSMNVSSTNEVIPFISNKNLVNASTSTIAQVFNSNETFKQHIQSKSGHSAESEALDLSRSTAESKLPPLKRLLKRSIEPEVPREDLVTRVSVIVQPLKKMKIREEGKRRFSPS